MDNVFGSPKINRRVLRVNNRDKITQNFTYTPQSKPYKSIATPTIVTWQTRGKGVQGEEVNSTNTAARFIVNKNWKPLQS